MATWVFPDNTVLCNFAAVGRIDLLRTFLGERGRWAEAVAAEARKSAGYLPALAELVGGEVMGEPIEVLDPSHIRRVEVIRRDIFGGRANQPLKHLGEAQTCFLIHEVDQWHESTWISDDRDSLNFARFQNIPSLETIDIMSHLVADYEVTAADGMSIMHAMEEADRALRLPDTISDIGG
ncbi:MAG: hypothetical protein L0H96_01850 [Humibacillus sp.]|nr:hypothetical protein [Humibacillus sp.]MDN5775637.1 hypothetical protein [Humibacillus sp.]